MGNESDTRTQWVATFKDLSSTLKEVVIILLVAFLLFWPSAINSTLQNAGFTHGDLMGLHWEKQMQTAVEQTGDARQEIESVEDDIDSVRLRLEVISRHSNDSTTRREVARLARGLDSSLAIVRAARQDLSHELNIQENLLAIAQKNDVTASIDAWGIVISTDRSLDEAQYEVRRAHRLGFDSVALYAHENTFRTVIPFDDQETAQDKLANVRERVRQSAYVAHINLWCQEPRLDPKTGVYDCR